MQLTFIAGVALVFVGLAMVLIQPFGAGWLVAGAGLALFLAPFKGAWAPLLKKAAQAAAEAKKEEKKGP